MKEHTHQTRKSKSTLGNYQTAKSKLNDKVRAQMNKSELWKRTINPKPLSTPAVKKAKFN